MQILPRVCSTGLDAPGKLAVRDFVRTINREDGVTVILTTYNMDDIEALCNRLLVIGNGTIIADGTFEIISASLHLVVRDVIITAPPIEEIVARLYASSGTTDQ